MTLGFALSTPLVAPRAAGFARAVSHAPSVALPARGGRVRMQVAGGPSAAASESLLAGGAVVDDGEEVELAEGEEVKVLSAPMEYVNGLAIKEARERFRLHETDTGSAEYQIATLTTRITYLTAHLKKNPKDYSSTRGLLKLVGTRRRLLKWLKKEDAKRFEAIIEGMGIRVSKELKSM